MADGPKDFAFESREFYHLSRPIWQQGRPLFGPHDLRHVRAHMGEGATASARAMNAHAGPLRMSRNFVDTPRVSCAPVTVQVSINKRAR